MDSQGQGYTLTLTELVNISSLGQNDLCNEICITKSPHSNTLSKKNALGDIC